MARRLKDFGDIRRLLASVINRLETGKIDPAVAGRITYTANVLLAVVAAERDLSIEKRLQALEAGEGHK